MSCVGPRKLAALLLVALTSGCAKDPAVSLDCPALPHGMTDMPCRASFRALANDPAAFDGRRVRMEGYLGVSARFFVLSSSKELFDAGVNDDTRVRIRGPMDSQQKIYDQYAYSWVAVTGTFRIRKKNGTTDDILIGELHPPMEVNALQFPIPHRRETFDEVALELEDLN